MIKSLKTILEKNGIVINNEELFLIAIKSNIDDLEFKRLETLGDALLNLIAIELLSSDNQNRSHNDLFHLRQYIITDEANITNYQILGLDTLAPNGKYERRFEAVLAAIHISNGYEKLKNWFNITFFETNIFQLNENYENSKYLLSHIIQENTSSKQIQESIIKVERSINKAALLYCNSIREISLRNNLSNPNIETNKNLKIWESKLSILEIKDIIGVGKSGMKSKSISYACIDYFSKMIAKILELQ